MHRTPEYSKITTVAVAVGAAAANDVCTVEDENNTSIRWSPQLSIPSMHVHVRTEVVSHAFFDFDFLDFFLAGAATSVSPSLSFGRCDFLDFFLAGTATSLSPSLSLGRFDFLDFFLAGTATALSPSLSLGRSAVPDLVFFAFLLFFFFFFLGFGASSSSSELSLPLACLLLVAVLVTSVLLSSSDGDSVSACLRFFLRGRMLSVSAAACASDRAEALSATLLLPVDRDKVAAMLPAGS